MELAQVLPRSGCRNSVPFQLVKTSMANNLPHDKTDVSLKTDYPTFQENLCKKNY
jgi:hypothetical protein